jgi:hypothetical protein
MQGEHLQSIEVLIRTVRSCLPASLTYPQHISTIPKTSFHSHLLLPTRQLGQRIPLNPQPHPFLLLLRPNNLTLIKLQTRLIPI